MAVLKCKMCGGNIEISGDARVIECEYCGTNQTIPDGSDEKKVNLFNRANRLRMDCEFDKAAGVYESIVSEYPEESEGYWGLVLCRFGIEYVDDAATGKKIPTCHRTNTTSIMDDADFEQVLENSDVIAKGTYREEAKAIDRLQRKIISVAESEEPYDVFICYKETDDITKQRTEDSSIAQDIYTELVREGYKVFFSRITLRDKAGTEYEPYIYAALSSAKVMLAIGTKYDYYDAVWVKNEWGRFISMMKNDNTKHLIPCFKNLDAYDIPKEFKNLQALDIGEMTFLKNLLDNVNRFIPKAKTETVSETIKETVVVQNQTVLQTEPLLKRVFMFLEDGNWTSADEYCEKVLDIDPECARAYLGKLMAELEVRKQDDLRNCEKTFDNNDNYHKTMRFADEKLKDELNEYIRFINDKINDKLEKQRLEKEKQQLKYEKKAEKFRIRNSQRNIFAGDSRTVGIKSDGTVVACGSNSSGQCNVFDWRDIVAVSAGYSHTVGIKSDGTVVACGDNSKGQCNVSNWRDIVAVSVELPRTVGIRSDGTVVACGDNSKGQCDVSDWRDIVAVSAEYSHTVGIRSDGTVVACGDNSKGQCDVSDWRDIVAVSAGFSETIGIKSDGTVVACGDHDGLYDVSDWRDIVAVFRGEEHIVGIKSDGTVVADGGDIFDQCDVSDWRDIVAVDAGYSHTVGIRSDGTVVACGSNSSGQCNVSDWRDIVAVAAGRDHTVGIKSDGTVVACGSNFKGQCNVSDWRDIAVPIITETKEEYEAEKEKIAELRREKQEKRRAEEEKRRAEEEKRRAEEEKRRAEEEKRRVEEARKAEANRRSEYMKLFVEKEALKKELSTLGFFAMGRKKEINTRLSEIVRELQRLNK